MKRIVVLSGVLAIGLVAVSFWLLAVRPERGPSEDAADQPAAAAPRKLEARWLLAGEVFWGRQMERIAEAQADPYGYLFSQLDTLERQDYDAWLAHLECPVTSAEIPFETQANSLIFNCRPEYLEEFSRWFDAVSLANNHMDNVEGAAGLAQTRRNLEEAGVQYYGHFDNSVKGDICEIVSLPVKITAGTQADSIKNFPVALCGYNNVFAVPGDDQLAEIEEYAQHFLVVASPQQGAEYQPTADELKRRTYRAMVDSGADLVVASHPHWVQDTEVYKGKLIMYSLGNFMFDQEWSEEVKRGAALDVMVSFELAETNEGWLEFDCSAFKDDCLKRAEESNLSKPNFDLGFELVSVLHEGGRTRKASADVHRLNLLRTNWDQTSRSLE